MEKLAVSERAENRLDETDRESEGRIVRNALLEGRLNLDADLLNALARAESEPEQSANRNRRWQDGVILNEIPRGAYVLDLGCGEGQLLGRLINEMNVHGQAVEVDPEAAMAAMEHGVPVLNIDISEALGDFRDQSFDFVILESTIQTLKDPMGVLSQMLRVGKRSIVSFPNFGHWRTRVDLAAKGRMPVTPSLPYQWYDTPNIRVLTISDFMDWCRRNAIVVTAAYGISEGKVGPLVEADSLITEEALMFIHRDEERKALAE
ncbi:MAG: methionine biosynthesis protein MetW [Deltaproteobacteria bacterium]|jgi:methionine biosynthesis protein MetW|nr:methionine biosynthesis protein MetW [Deltaproteobacteria bacterium]